MNQLNCIAPDEIEDADLWAYLEDAAPEHIVDHIQACAYCQQELQDLIDTDLALHAASIRLDCPDTAVLWQYVNDPATADQPVTDHINSCEQCQQEVQQIRRAIYMPDSPPAASLSDTLAQAGRKLVQAVLMPAPETPSLAMRGQSGESQTYQAAGYQIMIVRIPPTAVENVWQIEGQIMLTELLPEPFQATASIFLGEAKVGETEINPVGYFAIDDLEPGTYSLQLNLPAAPVLIADLQIG